MYLQRSNNQSENTMSSVSRVPSHIGFTPGISTESLVVCGSARQIIISGILPVFGNRIQGYRNSKRMAVNGMVERLCKEEDVGYVDLWDSFVGREDMYRRDGLDLSGKGAAVFAEGLSGAVASGLGKVRYLN